MVYGNPIFIREEAIDRQETLTSIHFQCETSLLSTPLICSRYYDMTVRGAERFVFSQQLAQN